MSRQGEHTPLSPAKENKDKSQRGGERGASMKQRGDEGPQEGMYCGQQRAAGISRTQEDDRNSRSKLSEGSDTPKDYGSVDVAKVCQACQHLYGEPGEVVLSPSHLQTIHSPPNPQNPATHRCVSLHRPWGARRYEGLCDCGASVSGGVCVCPGMAARGTLHTLLPPGAPWLKKAKVAALVMAALFPWAFLVAYLVLYYT